MERPHKVLQFPSDDLVYEQAATWIVRMDNGPLDSNAVAELKTWVRRSPAHIRALRDTALIWDRMDALDGLADLLSVSPLEQRSSQWRRWAIPLAVASCLVVVVAVLVASSRNSTSHTRPSPVVQDRNFSTPLGATKSVRLLDGSVVTLNTATRIHVDVSRTHRSVELLAGEAYFRVAHNRRIPFVVTAGNTLIRVVGTIFNVRRYPDQVEVTVAKGRVQVNKQTARGSRHQTSSAVPVILNAGQEIKVTSAGQETVNEIKPDQLARKILWRKKMLAFDGERLDKVVREFSRYSDVKLQIADARTAAIHVGGYFRSDDVAGLLTSLENNFSISVKQTGADTFRLQKKPQK